MQTRAATESFDFDLAFQLYCQACTYAQGLGLHHLDDQGTSSIFPNPITDDERKGFWELFQIGFFFRLFLDKPKAMELDVATWRTRFPYLSTDYSQSEDIEPVIFATNARITFIIADYLQAVGEGADRMDPDTASHIGQLCLDAQRLYDEWHIVSCSSSRDHRMD